MSNKALKEQDIGDVNVNMGDEWKRFMNDLENSLQSTLDKYEKLLLGDAQATPEMIAKMTNALLGKVLEDYFKRQKKYTIKAKVREAIDEFLNPLDEKAKSKAQQRLFGMVRQAQKAGKASSPKVAKIAKSISSGEAEKFASTKHKGLPNKVKK